MRRCRRACCDVTTGALGVVWFALWMICASESPSQHGRINTVERQYIIDTLMTEAVNSQQVSVRSDLRGGAENAGRENDGREIDGPICRA